MTTSAECTHLPLPELAHTRESLSVPAHTVSCTPGFSHSTRLARKDRDFRRRTYVRHIEMMMARKPTPEDLEEPFLKYFKTQRVQYGEDASCVFLLWGSLTPFQSSKFQVLKAIDIPIKSAGDTRIGKASEEKVLLDMRRAFHKHTKSWATYLGLRIISSVKPIKFRLIKFQEPGFLVSPIAADFSEDGEKCQRRLDEIHEQFEDYNDPEDFCYPDPDNNGKYTRTHNMCGYVNSTLSLEPSCPFEEWSILKSRIDWIASAAFLTYYFLYPNAAKDQSISRGRGERVLFKNTGLHHHAHLPISADHAPSSINYQLQHAAERRYLVLDGLHVEEQWRIPRAVILIIMVLFLVCVISRLVWKSWEIVFGAASFVVTATMLVPTMCDG